MKFLIFAIGLFCITCCVHHKIKYPHQESFFPIDSGNVWVYVDSLWVNDLLQEVTYDTVSVVETTNWDFVDLANFNLVIDNDSVYNLYKSKKGKEHLELWFVASKQRDTLHLDWEDDIVLSRLVEPINGPYIVNKMKYYQCYKYIDFCNSYYIIAKGVGIIESKEVQCQRRHQRVYKKSIVSYSLN